MMTAESMLSKCRVTVLPITIWLHFFLPLAIFPYTALRMRGVFLIDIIEQLTCLTPASKIYVAIISGQML